MKDRDRSSMNNEKDRARDYQAYLREMKALTGAEAAGIKDVRKEIRRTKKQQSSANKMIERQANQLDLEVEDVLAKARVAAAANRQKAEKMGEASAMTLADGKAKADEGIKLTSENANEAENAVQNMITNTETGGT